MVLKRMVNGGHGTILSEGVYVLQLNEEYEVYLDIGYE